MLVDYERVLLELKRHIGTKPHHGQRELAVVIAALEVDHQIEEGLPERALRQYGWEFFEEAVRGQQPTSLEGRVPLADGDQARALRGDSAPESQEDTHERSSDSRAHPGRHAASGRRRPAARAA